MQPYYSEISGSDTRSFIPLKATASNNKYKEKNFTLNKTTYTDRNGNTAPCVEVLDGTFKIARVDCSSISTSSTVTVDSIELQPGYDPISGSNVRATIYLRATASNNNYRNASFTLSKTTYTNGNGNTVPCVEVLDGSTKIARIDCSDLDSSSSVTVDTLGLNSIYQPLGSTGVRQLYLSATASNNNHKDASFSLGISTYTNGDGNTAPCVNVTSGNNVLARIDCSSIAGSVTVDTIGLQPSYDPMDQTDTRSLYLRAAASNGKYKDITYSLYTSTYTDSGGNTAPCVVVKSGNDILARVDCKSIQSSVTVDSIALNPSYSNISGSETRESIYLRATASNSKYYDRTFTLYKTTYTDGNGDTAPCVEVLVGGNRIARIDCSSMPGSSGVTVDTIALNPSNSPVTGSDVRTSVPLRATASNSSYKDKSFTLNKTTYTDVNGNTAPCVELLDGSSKLGRVDCKSIQNDVTVSYLGLEDGYTALSNSERREIIPLVAEASNGNFRSRTLYLFRGTYTNTADPNNPTTDKCVYLMTDAGDIIGRTSYQSDLANVTVTATGPDSTTPALTDTQERNNVIYDIELSTGRTIRTQFYVSEDTYKNDTVNCVNLTASVNGTEMVLARVDLSGYAQTSDLAVSDVVSTYGALGSTETRQIVTLQATAVSGNNTQYGQGTLYLHGSTYNDGMPCAEVNLDGVVIARLNLYYLVGGVSVTIAPRSDITALGDADQRTSMATVATVSNGNNASISYTMERSTYNGGKHCVNVKYGSTVLMRIDTETLYNEGYATGWSAAWQQMPDGFAEGAASVTLSPITFDYDNRAIGSGWYPTHRLLWCESSNEKRAYESIYLTESGWSDGWDYVYVKRGSNTNSMMRLAIPAPYPDVISTLGRTYGVSGKSYVGSLNLSNLNRNQYYEFKIRCAGETYTYYLEIR